MGWTFLPIEQLPEPGDIVWCKFPLRERPGRPGLWSRPALVLGTNVHEDPETKTKFGSVQVAYGTDLQKMGTGLYFPITTKARAIAIGLHKPTAFGLSGGHVKNLIWCSDFFVPSDYVRNRGLLIGRLSDTEKSLVRGILEKT